MKEPFPMNSVKPEIARKERSQHVFHLFLIMMLLAVVGTVCFLAFYNPAPVKSHPQITFDQKMAHLQSGTPLPGQSASMTIPRWIIALVLGFLLIQILPLLVAAHKVKKGGLSRQEIRQVEFLTETPMFLGLLGSLVGVCMTQFISGTLAAPLAYLTSISGILLYLFGRFTILVSLPDSNELS